MWTLISILYGKYSIAACVLNVSISTLKSDAIHGRHRLLVCVPVSERRDMLLPLEIEDEYIEAGPQYV